MRWQLDGDWPVGQWCIPVGTVLTGVARDGGELVVKWNEIELPMPPLNSAALDEEAALLMLKSYPDQWHRLHFGAGIDRDALMARAEEARRWPLGRPAGSTKG
jgi:hypothetical protein